MTLRLIYSQEQKWQELIEWQWPGDARSVSFDEIMAQERDLSCLASEYGKLLSIERGVSAHVKVWWIVNLVQDLVCAVNGKMLKVGFKRRLKNGDVIEFGFSRFNVILEGADRVAMDVEQADEVAFSLTDLAGTDDAPLERLLGQDSRMSLEMSTMHALNNTSSEADVMTQLHAQYLRQLQAPWLSSTDGDSWMPLQQATQRTTVDPMDQLQTAAGTRSDLSDLLGGPQNMKDVMASLNRQGEQNILTADVQPSVMKLFAPIGYSSHAVSGAMPSDVPSLTQREHHSVSLDSAVPSNFFDKPTASKHAE